MPLHFDLALVDRCLEGFGGLCLRHTRHFGYVATVVAVGSVYGVIHSEQIAVAIAVGRSVRVHAAAMSVVGVAVETRTAHGSRTESFEARVGRRELTLKELLAGVEVVDKSLCGYGR